MEIELKEITIRSLSNDYKNDNIEGVSGYGGKLDIRPQYQREFIYKDKQRDSVIDTVKKEFPLNVMYWATNADGTYEVLDGQQRTISVCEYVAGAFSIDSKYFHNLETVDQDQILDYTLMVYFCEGNTKEKLDWFRTINIAGEKLSDQELLNAVYSGKWLTNAKEYFSKTAGVAYNIGKQYLKGSCIRQEYLETALKWINDGDIAGYMAIHQKDLNAHELWLYFSAVIEWVKKTFPDYRKEMKGVDFGYLYARFKNYTGDITALKIEIQTLMEDEDVTQKSGVYTYVLTREEKYLNVRAFSDNKKREAFEKQKGVCHKCEKIYEDISKMEADHITPWSKGGKTTSANCQMLCKSCNRTKSSK